MNKLLKNNFNIIVGFLISLIVMITMISLNNTNAIIEVELKTIDLRFKALHSFMKPPSKDIVVVGFDDSSISKIGRWPWKRNEQAKIVNFLKLYGAKAVIYDVFFSNADKDHPKSDSEFAQAIKNAGNVYLAGKFIPITENDKNSNLYRQSLEKFAIKASNIPSRNVKDIMPQGQVPFYEVPYAEFLNNARNIGHVHIGRGDDGKIRYQDLIYTYQNKYYPSITLTVALDLLKQNKIYSLVKKSVQFADKTIPLDEKNRMIINWKVNSINENGQFKPPYAQYGAERFTDSYTNILKASKACGVSPQKFKELLDHAYYYQLTGKNMPDDIIKYLDKIPPDFELKFNGGNPTDLFKDKIVFVGVSSTSTTVRDFISTPFFQDIPGVYMHANVLDNILNNDALHKTDKNTTNTLIIMAALLTFLSIFAIRKSILAVIIPILLAPIYLLITFILFAKYNTWIDLVHVELTIILTFALSSITYYILEGKSKKLIKQAMANYLAPQIMEAVLDNPELLKLGGSKRELTILFSDIRGFTTLSESSEPEEIVQMLNEYFSAMVAIIIKNNGTIDKFIGDAIMAFWNAPVETKNHEYLAVKSALEMMEELERLKEKWQSEGKMAIDIGIGINTGEVIVGNIGSQSIKDYTIIGDNVNITSRLEGLNKECKTHILISESTYERIKDKVDCNYLISKQLKGKNKSIRVYEVKNPKVKNMEEQCKISD